MRIAVTGSAGHLGEALIRTLADGPHEAWGLDLLDSPFTRRVGSINDRAILDEFAKGADVVVHSATLHKPHIVSHSEREFVETNVLGTLNVLEAAARVGAAVVFLSTTSTFGAALRPAMGRPAAWITEDVRPIPRNIYGVTKVAAEDLCELHHRRDGLPCVVLKLSRFFPEADDDPMQVAAFDDLNLKVNELLYRRVDLADAVDAVVRACERVGSIGFDRYIISATTPFEQDEADGLGTDAPAVVAQRFSDYGDEFARRGWKMLPRLDRVYVNEKARSVLEWAPKVDFRTALDRLKRNEAPFDPLARAVGIKGYHSNPT